MKRYLWILTLTDYEEQLTFYEEEQLTFSNVKDMITLKTLTITKQQNYHISKKSLT